ncbi:MAG TPA: hypothetical protein VE983_02090, partial [Solirubrobacteraceae bacterium]|nr:hypothetical protein [Solirubrobacteraceae bacterium]
PQAATCARVRAAREVPPILALDPRPRAPRIFAVQFKQDLHNVTTYARFRAKIRCLIREYVLPHLARGRPNLVVFNEDVGLMTLAIGTRGAAARRAFGGRGSPSCQGEGEPCGTLAALAAVSAAYSPQIAAYQERFHGRIGPLVGAFVGATDTTVRAFAQTFSRLALRYHFYLVGSMDLPPFRQSSSRADIALFHDPDRPPPRFVYVATSPRVHNEVFMWGPHDVRHRGPGVLRNLVASNLKVPLTPLERQIGFTPGPARGRAAVANLHPYRLPGTRVRIGFATSLPAFQYGPLRPGQNPCSNVSVQYMRCLNRLGANLVLQDEANPGEWTGPDGSSKEQWQPLSWMLSTYRAVSDPSVHFDYNVTAMMVGNLADLPFDGQTAITQRGLRGRGCHYIGNGRWVAGQDLPSLRRYAGPQKDFLAIAPWVVSDRSRDRLRAVGNALAPGSGQPLQNDYVETAIVADLPVPVDPRREGCVG